MNQESSRRVPPETAASYEASRGDRAFMVAAACHDDGPHDALPAVPDWFGEPFDPSGMAAAIVCIRRCPVRLECLQYALTNAPSHGIWGGVDNGTLAWLRRTMPAGITPVQLARALLRSHPRRSDSKYQGAGDAA